MHSAPKQPLRKYQFPLRHGNQFELLVDGENFFPRMLDSIANARRYVLLEMYLMESGQVANRFIDTCVAAARRGVRFYVLLDDFGCKGLGEADRERLTGAGIRLLFYNPLSYRRMSRNLFRNHRKLLLVDGEIAYTGGTGLIDEFDTAARPESGWHEVMVAIHGPCVSDWHALFFANYSRWHPEEPVVPVASTPSSGTQAGRVVSSRTPLRSEIMRSLVRRIRYAEQRVWLMTAYFVPPRKLRRVMRQCARRGVDVRIVLPGPRTDHAWVRYIGRRYYARLLRNGVRIFEYQPRFLHAKVLLCDDWCSVGSSNTDRWNFRWNLEANQEIDGVEMADRIAAMFEDDIGQCREYTYEQWLERPWNRRIWEWLVGFVVVALAWFSYGWNDPRRDSGP